MFKLEEELEELKTKLNRMHFLLTDTITDETKVDIIGQFQICFEAAFAALGNYLKETFNEKPVSAKYINKSAFKHGLYNERMTILLTEMIDDYTISKKRKNNDELLPAIQSSYTGVLQMFYDMLIRMGEDAQEEV